jgi:hypothetical protein
VYSFLLGRRIVATPRNDPWFLRLASIHLGSSTELNYRRLDIFEIASSANSGVDFYVIIRTYKYIPGLSPKAQNFDKIAQPMFVVPSEMF